MAELSRANCSCLGNQRRARRAFDERAIVAEGGLCAWASCNASVFGSGTVIKGMGEGRGLTLWLGFKVTNKCQPT